MDETRSVATVQLGEGVQVLVETDSRLGHRMAVEAAPSDVIQMIEDIGRSAMRAARSLAPSSFGMEFGIEVGGEAGIPFLAKGTATANFVVTLEWKREASETGSSSAS